VTNSACSTTPSSAKRRIRRSRPRNINSIIRDLGILGSEDLRISGFGSQDFEANTRNQCQILRS
jgi:hypothetical protein